MKCYMEKRRLKSEKTVVFDDNGDPKELRYYEDGRLSARLGVILDSDKNFIGLRELDIEEVAPPSWLDRLRLRKREPSRISIQTIDFIGLINWINTIKTIKTIENINLIDAITNIANIQSVDLIDEITKIGEITTIRDLMHTPKSFIVNPFWTQGFTGWVKSGSVSVIDSGDGRNVLYFLDAPATGYLWQDFPIPFDPTWMSEFYLMLMSGYPSVNLIKIEYYYTDGTTTNGIFQVTTGAWEKKTLSPTSTKKVKSMKITHETTYRSCYLGWLTTVF